MPTPFTPLDKRKNFPLSVRCVEATRMHACVNVRRVARATRHDGEEELRGGEGVHAVAAAERGSRLEGG
jgi:hypothetical protein